MKKIYIVEKRATVGAYKMIKVFSKRELAEAFLENIIDHDPDAFSKNPHKCNYYRIREDIIDEEEK